MDDYFDRLLFRAGFTPATFAKWLRISERTVKNWRQHGAPLMALRCLELRAGYDEHWKGFRIVNNEIHTATGHTFNSFQIEQYSWFMHSQYRTGYEDGYEQRERNSQRLLRLPVFDGLRRQDETRKQSGT
jgi:hypothetical protein